MNPPVDALPPARRNLSPREAPTLIDLRQVLQALRERWAVALVLVLFVCGPLAAWLLLRPPVYAARASLLMERSRDQVVEIKQVVDDTVEREFIDALLLTHIERLHSHTFLRELIDLLSPLERAQVLESYPGKFLQAGDDRLSTTDLRDRRLERYLDKNLTVERVGRTLLMAVTLRHRDPEVAQQLANKLGEQYVKHLIRQASGSNDSAVEFLTEQVAILKENVEQSERALQGYRKKYGLASFEENQNIIVDRFKALNVSATQAQVARLALDTRLKQAGSVGRDVMGARQLSSLPEFATFAALQKQIDDLAAQRDVMAERYGRLHPSMVQNATALEALRRQQDDNFAAALADLKNQRDKALAYERQLGEQLAAAELESLRLDQLGVGYNVLKRAVESDRATYAQLLSRLNDTTISRQLQNTNVKFVDRAALPDRPVEPNVAKIVPILGVLGVALFVGYPLAAGALDSRVKSWADIEADIPAPLLGEITYSRRVRKKERLQIVARDSDEHVVEAFRGFLSQLQFISKVECPKTVLVTSTLPAEGKSFIACNLAASLAAHGRRVLLMDADFRKPSLHRAFSLKNDRGVLPWLKMDEGAQRGPLLEDPALGVVEIAPKLHLLRSGGGSHRVTEELQSGRIVDLMEGLQRLFDVILIDTPPAGLFPDAEALARVADELIYVCRFNTTGRSHLSQVLARFGHTDLALAGIVLNAMPAGRFGSYYNSGYAYAGARRYKRYYAGQPRG